MNEVPAEGNGEKGQLGGLWSIVCVSVCVWPCVCMYESNLNLNCMSLSNLFLVITLAQY